MKLFSNFTLKIMAIIFMAMDHIYTYMNVALNNQVPIWFGYLGKLAAPIFFYLIVEGFYHTRSKYRYMQRIFSMGILMIIVDLLFKIHNNIFLSLGFAIAMLSMIEQAKLSQKGSKKRIINIILAISFGVLGLFTEASLYGVGMVLIFYFLREKKVAMTLAYIVFSLAGIIGFIGPNFIEVAFLWDYQWMMVFAIIPILMYNGKLGISNKFIKWMFYWFYPIHLIIIVLIANFINM
ncbi:F pilin acetylation protein [[Clostridium] sordellii]|uniref:TraX family protein n=1 Tax=Paraclostridium sordellii TaxID=1505 RepID=A0ABM9RQ78_PARSO|nr:TraX family protein [Paeniclostridium sordellii]CEJ74180.1 traX family protein [[Clostridium] sordellii] [Paeniclostridium sordellii]CEN69724.1 F pilin acetylation protein [[Clostridium] sordellii] [Paeniclostridium sordellii]CEN72992.1 F pilin acetylation protein [[Clostridium] sordellii] [Paeniclostridium sordellii]CEP75415.1 F pilin acetylation protein [[Clostridium] sordellii] [Paeniclostridium sordellii]